MTHFHQQSLAQADFTPGPFLAFADTDSSFESLKPLVTFSTNV